MPTIQTITPKDQSLPGLAGVPFPKHIKHYENYGSFNEVEYQHPLIS